MWTIDMVHRYESLTRIIYMGHCLQAFPNYRHYGNSDILVGDASNDLQS